MSCDGVSYVTVITGARMNGAEDLKGRLIDSFNERHSFTFVETEIPIGSSRDIFNTTCDAMWKILLRSQRCWT